MTAADDVVATHRSTRGMNLRNQRRNKDEKEEGSFCFTVNDLSCFYRLPINAIARGSTKQLTASVTQRSKGRANRIISGPALLILQGSVKAGDMPNKVAIFFSENGMISYGRNGI
jgi:hypothetical protein